jgi:predicted nucleic acid-binding protein
MGQKNSMVYVCNSTPIIAFSKIHRIDILSATLNNIIVPEAVYKELLEQGKNRPGSSEIKEADWIKVEKVKNQEYVRFLQTDLDFGEAEVIALAYEKRADLVIIDEKIARRIARQIGLDVIGSIGILLKAKDMGIISHIKPLWDNMIACGLRYSDHFYSEILRKIGEL